MCIFWAWAGCAAGVRSVEEQPLFAAGWTGPPPRVAVLLAGPDASSDKQARCTQALARAGAVVDGGAAAQAVVTLAPEGNRLQVMTHKRGLVRDEPRPSWTIERLCDDALLALVDAIRGDAPAPPAPPLAAPGQPELSQPYSAMPLSRDRDRELPPDQPTTPPEASGGIHRGPIQP
jgi:hypothetical protein